MIKLMEAFSAASPVRKAPRRKIISIAAALVIICSIVTITAFAAAATYKVTIEEDGAEPIVISTRKESLEEFLEENSKNVKIGEYDYLDASDFKAGDNCSITIHRAQPIRVVDNGEVYYLNGAGTAENLLKKHNRALGKFDEINLEAQELVSPDKTLEVSRSFGVTVEADGKQVDVEIASGTVADAVSRAGITLGENDETVPTAQSSLVSEMTIRVLRVEYKERTETESIPFDTITRKTPDLYVDQTKVSVKGQEGEKQVTYKDRYVNGELDSSETVNTEITKQAVDEIVLKGKVQRVSSLKLKGGLTPISELKVPSTLKLNSKGLPTNYKRIVDGTATAYYGGTGTASGRKPKPGYIAVDPKQFPYGTELYIVSLDGKYIYGYCIAADTGGFVRQNTCTVDLYMNTYAECCAWGHRGVRIYVL